MWNEHLQCDACELNFNYGFSLLSALFRLIPVLEVDPLPTQTNRVHAVLLSSNSYPLNPFHHDHRRHQVLDVAVDVCMT